MKKSIEKMNDLSILDALKKLNELDSFDSFSDDFDVRWEQKFGSDDCVSVMSVDDFFKEFDEKVKFV